MNRRAFLRGLLASGAAIAVAPVLHVVPVVDYEALLAKHINAAYAATLRRNAYGVMARITYTPDAGLDYVVMDLAEVYLDAPVL